VLKMDGAVVRRKIGYKRVVREDVVEQETHKRESFYRSRRRTREFKGEPFREIEGVIFRSKSYCLASDTKFTFVRFFLKRQELSPVEQSF